MGNGGCKELHVVGGDRGRYSEFISHPDQVS